MMIESSPTNVYDVTFTCNSWSSSPVVVTTKVRISGSFSQTEEQIIDSAKWNLSTWFDIIVSGPDWTSEVRLIGEE